MSETPKKPSWLPEMFRVDPWTEKSFDILYEIFKQSFISSKAYYKGFVVWFFPEKEDSRETIFWHLTTREDKESGVRLPDFRRCERLPWARPMIDNANDPSVFAWDFEEGNGDIKTYVWLKDFDYLIILKKYKDGQRRLITSFWVEYQNFKEKLLKKYKNRLEK
jgi:hypothetical protein